MSADRSAAMQIARIAISLVLFRLQWHILQLHHTDGANHTNPANRPLFVWNQKAIWPLLFVERLPAFPIGEKHLLVACQRINFQQGERGPVSVCRLEDYE